MKVKALITCSEQFEFQGRKFVRLQGIMNGKQIFKQTVSEKLVPDNLEGKDVAMEFAMGFDSSCKPYLKFKSIGIASPDFVPDEIE